MRGSGTRRFARGACALAVACGALLATTTPARAATYTNTTGAGIPGAGTATAGCATPELTTADRYPSSLVVSGEGPAVQDVNITVVFSHERPADAELLLVGPDGAAVVLMADSGYDYNNIGLPVTLTFDDEATSTLPTTFAPLQTGSYRPSPNGPGGVGCVHPASLPSPAPASPYGGALSVFDGSDPNGTWQLFLVDDTYERVGAVWSWSLDINAPGGDAIPPTVSCRVTPAKVWPPNHRMVEVTASVTVSDVGSGPAGFTLVSVTSSEPDAGLAPDDVADDIVGWTTGTADTSGSLRAERFDGRKGRTYTLVYRGRDVAGNSSTCTATVTVRG